MPKGMYGKFDVAYQSMLAMQAKGKPHDKMPKQPEMTQNESKCAAGYTCAAGNMWLSKCH